ncbi:MAG: AAA family ATPase [Candidatus Paracaedibacter sp.]
MNFLHYKMGNVSRSSGRSPVQAVCYIARAEFHEERRGINADYSAIKDHEVFWETLGPKGSGIAKDDLSIWNKVEKAEDEILTKRYKDAETREQKINSAVPAYSDHLALPKELSKEQNIELAREFIQKRYVDKGLVATYSIHWEEGNPHLHYVYSTRQYSNGEFSSVKTVSRETRGIKGGHETRIIQADIINRYQELLGIPDRVDHRSYAERGIDLIPTQHKGYMSHQLERDGHYSRIGKQNEEILEENKERIAQEPGIVLKELTSKQATFSENDVMKLVQHRLKDDMGILGEHVFQSVMKEAVEVGKNFHEQIRYTSQEYADKEDRILGSLEGYQNQKAFLKIDSLKVEAYLNKLEEHGKEKGYLPNEGQVNGIKTMCEDSQLYIMVGRAGTGKTTTLKAVVDLHKEAGYQVWGMAPSATAATQLGDDTGCYSDTISHFAYYWKKYDEALVLLHEATTDKEMKVAQEAIDKYKGYLPNSETLLIVDEAGMVGAGDLEGKIPGGWDAITKTIDKTGAKLALTGDDHQLKPIESSDVLRHLIYNLEGTPNLCKLTEIKRQNTPWMQEASHHFSEFNVSTALGMYESNGYIHSYELNDDIYKAIAQEYLQNILNQPGSKGAVIAATNEERQALNSEIRSILKENGLLPKKDIMHIGELGYTTGDKIVFTENDRGWNTSVESKKEGFFVQNSMQATIQSIRPFFMVDKQTGEKIKSFQIVAHVFDDSGNIKGKVSFDTIGDNGGIKGKVTLDAKEYRAFTHGYAGTVWKNQGNTVDWAIAKLSKYIDANSLYVGATRHRDTLSMYYSKEDFTDYKQLVNSLSRINVKDMVVDYSISDENKEYWHNVQDYKATGRELLGIRTLANSLDKDNKENKVEIEEIWKNYKVVEADRKSWANHILRDWDVHRDFVRQAGLSKESLEIAAGLKKRTLCRVEIEAQQVVEQYIAVSLEARELWRDIRKTHPGSRAKSHPEWLKFVESRDQRGVLANQIHINPILHRPFLKETAESLAKVDIGYVSQGQKISYSMGTIKVQAEAHQTKMLQLELLKDNTEGRSPPNLAQQDMLKVLIAYTDNRDMAGQIWAEVRPKLKEFEGTLLKEAFSKAIFEYTEVRMKRDAAASLIMERQEAFTELAEMVGMKLDFEKLGEQAIQATRDRLLKVYQTSLEEMTKLEAAHELNAMAKSEAELDGKKLTISQVYQQGLQPKDIARDALEYQKIKLYEGLKTEPERALFLLLDEYDSKCRAANQIYGQCIEETKGKDKNAWESSHYPAYKAACNSRNDVALEVFDQRDHNEVLSMAKAMGMRFKETELQEIFSRCEQATRTNNIISYNTTSDEETKGKAAVALRQMIEFEKRETGTPSKTAQQAFHSGIDFKELQNAAFDYGRLCLLKGLSSEKEVQLYHSLQAYENAYRPANKAFKDCIEESKEKTTKDLEIKPWETEKYKEYLSFASVQDEKAYQLVKGHDLASINKIAKEMGISPKKLDVEAHRHSLRQTLQTFVDGDRTNVPLAAKEVLSWLDFDRHSDHKQTFKILREQDLWPKDIQKALDGFFEKKRELRHEEHRELKNIGQSKAQGRSLTPEYQTITYERYQSFEEVDKLLKERMFELATYVLGNPASRTSNQLRFGKKGSICVFTNGPKQGLYANHETGVYGGPLKLIEEQAGLSSAKDSLKWASEWLGDNPLVIEQRVVEKTQNNEQQSTWTPITPVPKEVSGPDIEGNKYLNYMIKDGAKETHRHAYRDEVGNLKGYVFRIEKADGSKFTPPLAYCENEKGFKAWKWQAFEKENKTPYGIEKLAQEPNKPILIVEGEKTCDAAQKLLAGHNVLTWSGGAGNVGKTNWECLAGREITIWPDNDVGGIKAADTLQKIVSSINTEKNLHGSVGIVPLPHSLPEKWDLADKLPEGWTVDTIKEMIKNVGPTKDIKRAYGQNDIKTVSTTPTKAVNIEKVATQFIELCILYENTPWGEPGEKELSRKIEDFAGKYINNERFKQRVEACGNEAVIERFHTEMEEQKHLMQDIQTPSITSKSSLSKESVTPTKDINIEKVATQFIDLCVLYENTPWGEPGEKELSRKIEDFAGKYMQNEEFRNRIATSGNDIAISRFQIEMEEQIHVLKDDMQSVGLNNETSLAVGSSSNDINVSYTTDAKINLVANEFVELCVLYENTPWGEPGDKETLRKIEKLAGEYMNNEEFRQKIEASKNEIAIERFKSEVEEQKQNMSQNMSRGI